MLSTSNCE